MKTNCKSIGKKSISHYKENEINFKLSKKFSALSILIGMALSSPVMAITTPINEGENNSISNGYHYVIGDNNVIVSNEQNQNVIYGNDNTLIDADYSLVGQENNLTGGYGVIVGDLNDISSSDGHNSFNNVVGNSNTAEGNNINMLGSNSNMTGDNSTALGNNTVTNANNSVTIGTASTNNRDNTVSIGSQGAERQLTNVAQGVADTDGVNVSQLNQKAQETLNSANNYTDSKAKETLNSANNYTDDKINENSTLINQNIDNAKNEVINSFNEHTDYWMSQLNGKNEARLNQLDKRIDRLENKVNAGLAGVTAIASIPYVQMENFSFGIGVGNYKSGNAVAVGAQFKPSQNTNVRLNVSWDNESNSAIGAGFAVGW